MVTWNSEACLVTDVHGVVLLHRGDVKEICLPESNVIFMKTFINQWQYTIDVRCIFICTKD